MSVHQMHLRLRRPQLRVFHNPARHKIVVAGRRFGKTFLALTLLIISACKYRRSRNWYIAPTRPMAKDIAWEDLKFLLGVSTDLLGNNQWGNPLIKDVSESELTVTFINNATITLKGASDVDKLRGRGLKMVVLDEYADMDPEVWVVIRPQLSDKRLRLEYGELGRTLFIGTPKGYNHFKDLYDEVRSGQKGHNWAAWRYTSLEGGNIDASEILEAKGELAARDFRQEYEATFESIEGRIYHSFMREFYRIGETFNRGNLDASILDPGGPICVGMDFNVNPMSATLSSKVRTDRPWGSQFEKWTWKEYSIPNCNTAGMMRAIRNDFPNRHLIVFPDPTGRARSTTADEVSQTDHTIIQSFGADVYLPKFSRNADKYNCVNGLLCNTNGIRRQLINPQTCKILVKSYDGLCYKEGSNEPDKSHGLDHMSDADAYSTLGLFPLMAATVNVTTASV